MSDNLENLTSKMNTSQMSRPNDVNLLDSSSEDERVSDPILGMVLEQFKGKHRLSFTEIMERFWATQGTPYVQPSGPRNDDQDIGRSFYRLGKIHYDKADLGLARRYFEQALMFAHFPTDAYAVSKTLGFLIRLASEQGDQQNANQYIAASEQVMEKLGQELNSLNAEYFYHLGVVKMYRGLFAEARDYFQLAFKRSKEENEAEVLAKCLLALANHHYHQKELGMALDLLEQLDELLGILQKKYLQGSMDLLKAKVYQEKGEHDLALRFFDAAMEQLARKNCWNLFGYILLGKGVVYKNKGAFVHALTIFDLAQSTARRDVFKRLHQLIDREVRDVNDASVDIYLDRTHRKIIERNIGTIDFKHRFVLLEILFLLAKNPGVYYDKEQLAQTIWGDEYNPLIHDKLIYTSVSRLRKLIEPPSVKKEVRRKYIIRGKDGYTFNPQVKIRFHMDNKSISDSSIGNVELGSPV
jgi:tetratricopeptide (TPR) repeat protein